MSNRSDSFTVNPVVSLVTNADQKAIGAYPRFQDDTLLLPLGGRVSRTWEKFETRVLIDADGNSVQCELAISNDLLGICRLNPDRLVYEFEVEISAGISKGSLHLEMDSATGLCQLIGDFQYSDVRSINHTEFTFSTFKGTIIAWQLD